MAATSSCWGPTPRASAPRSVAAALNPLGSLHLLVAQCVGMPVVEHPAGILGYIIGNPNVPGWCEMPTAPEHVWDLRPWRLLIAVSCHWNASGHHRQHQKPQRRTIGPRCVGQGAAVGVGHCWCDRTRPSLGCTSACCCNCMRHHRPCPSTCGRHHVLLDSVMMAAELLRGRWAAAHKLWSSGGGASGQVSRTGGPAGEGSPGGGRGAGRRRWVRCGLSRAACTWAAA